MLYSLVSTPHSPTLISANTLSFTGTNLLPLYDYSAVGLVSVEFPSHPWAPWRFSRSPRQWWTDIRKQMNSPLDNSIVAEAVIRLYLEDLGHRWEIHSDQTWLQIAKAVDQTSAESLPIKIPTQEFHVEKLRFEKLGSLQTVLAWLRSKPSNSSAGRLQATKEPKKIESRTLIALVEDNYN